MDFQEDVTKLQHVTELLRRATDASATPDQRAEAINTVELEEADADWYSYCAAILVRHYDADDDGASVTSAVATAAGRRILKNFNRECCSNNAIVQELLLDGLASKHAIVRRGCATVVGKSFIALFSGRDKWPTNETMSRIKSMLQQDEASSAGEEKDAILGALLVIEEVDSVADAAAVHLLDGVLALLLPLTNHSSPTIRAAVANTISVFAEQCTIYPDEGSYEEHAGAIVETFVAGMPSATPEEQINMMRTLILSLEVPAVAPYREAIGELALEATVNAEIDTRVRQEALEYWYAATLVPELNSTIEALLPRVVGGLLSCMVYSDDEVAKVDERDAQRLTDHDAEKLLADDGAEKSDDDRTIRRAAAGVLDQLAEGFGLHVLSVSLPHIQDALSRPQNGASYNWRETEAAVLALGAMATGAASELVPFCSQVVEKISGFAADASQPVLLRAISVWTLQRILVDVAVQDNAIEGVISASVAAILACMTQSESVHLAFAATTAMTTIIEASAGSESPSEFNAALPQICAAFGSSVENTSSNSILSVLMDGIEALVGNEQAVAEHGAEIAGIISFCWERFSSDIGAENGKEDVINRLMSCTSSVLEATAADLDGCFTPDDLSFMVAAIMELFEPNYAVLVENIDDDDEADLTTTTSDERVEMIVVSCLDFFGGAATTFVRCEPSPSKWPAPLQRPFMEKLLPLCEYRSNGCISPHVRQSAFGLFSDYCGKDARIVQRSDPSLLDALVDVMVRQIDAPVGTEEDHPPASNILWTCVQLLLAAEEQPKEGTKESSLRMEQVNVLFDHVWSASDAWLSAMHLRNLVDNLVLFLMLAHRGFSDDELRAAPHQWNSMINTPSTFHNYNIFLNALENNLNAAPTEKEAAVRAMLRICIVCGAGAAFSPIFHDRWASIVESMKPPSQEVQQLFSEASVMMKKYSSS